MEQKFWNILKYSNYPSNFNALNLKKKITFKKIDLRDSKKIIKEIKKFQPDYIFHLAAEAIVKGLTKTLNIHGKQIHLVQLIF